MAIRFYTYKRQVPLKPGQKLGYIRGKGYFAVTAVMHGTPNPPAPAMLTLMRTIFWGQMTDDAVGYALSLKGWRHALSADRGVYGDTGGSPKPEWIDKLKRAGVGVDAWGVQTQIPPAQIADFHQRYGLDRIIHQAENPPEAATVTANYVIGNLTLLGLGDQFGKLNDRVKAGRLGASCEVYNGRPDTFDTNGFVISSFLLGVTIDQGNYYPLRGLIEKTPVGARSSCCIWHGQGVLTSEADRPVLYTL